MSDAVENMEVEPGMVWCAQHLEPWRADWPNGYLPATLCLTYQALRDSEVLAAAGGNAGMLGRVIREFGPLCCRYPDAAAELVGFIRDDTDLWRQLLKKWGPSA